MMMYNPETTEIAKPSELLNGVRAYMNVLQGLENYGKPVSVLFARGCLWVLLLSVCFVLVLVSVTCCSDALFLCLLKK